ncbi:MAG: RidA family protein [Candidatus Latescibacterota bacterium]|jgi:2-iminobutanoate/2-iminopropanoate deaminase
MKKAIQTDRAPEALGPYSQAVLSGDTLFLSAQVGIDPSVGKIVAADAAGQTRQVMSNLEAVLEESGMDFADVVKTTIYLASLDDFRTVNGVYGEFFVTDPPARATIQAAALPLGALVAIEAIARR